MGTTLEDDVSTRFGRAPYFIFIDDETDTILTAVENDNASAGGGAGVSAAQLVVDQGANVLLTGNCGPKAFQVCEAGEVEVFIGASGTLAETLQAYREGTLKKSVTPNVSAHKGMNT